MRHRVRVRLPKRKRGAADGGNRRPIRQRGPARRRSRIVQPLRGRRLRRARPRPHRRGTAGGRGGRTRGDPRAGRRRSIAGGTPGGEPLPAGRSAGFGPPRTARSTGCRPSSTGRERTPFGSRPRRSVNGNASGSLAAVEPACQRIEARYLRSQAADRELAGLRRRHGLPDYATPRASGRGWVWLLLAVALAETTANGLLLHAASTEGVVSNWLFAGLVTAMNVGLLGWLIGDLVFRRMLGAGALRRSLLAAALLPCLALAVLLHFGFAHYRDAVQALDGARAASVLDLDDIDAGIAGGTAVADPHPPEPLTVGGGGHLRTPGAVPLVAAGDDPGRTSTRVAGGRPLARRDPHACRRERRLSRRRRAGWCSPKIRSRGGSRAGVRSFCSASVSRRCSSPPGSGYGGREPIPHFARLHRARASASEALRDGYARSLQLLNDEEGRHRQRLGDHEAGLLSLGGRLTELDGTRRRVLAAEAELLARSAAAGATAVADFRQANRGRRLSHDPAPRFWSAPWAPGDSPRSDDHAAAWDRDQEAGLFEIAQAAGAGPAGQRSPRGPDRFRLRGGPGTACPCRACPRVPPPGAGPARRESSVAAGREGGSSRAEPRGEVRSSPGDRFLTPRRLAALAGGIPPLPCRGLQRGTGGVRRLAGRAAAGGRCRGRGRDGRAFRPAARGPLDPDSRRGGTRAGRVRVSRVRGPLGKLPAESGRRRR